MPHRFTEPTPVSRRSQRCVDVFVASWEIECCVPPPVVASPSTWLMQFISGEGTYRAALDRDYTWLATPWPADTGQPIVTQLSDGMITAQWMGDPDDEPPHTGVVQLRGHLSGTAHFGAVPESFPRITGVVHRIQLVTQDFTWISGRCWEPVPASTTLTDIQCSPRWFTGPPAPQDHDQPWTQRIGVLLELAVPES